MADSAPSVSPPAPWWASSATAFYFTLGPSTILLFFFAGILTGGIDSPLLQARDLVKTNQDILRDHISVMQRDHQAQLKMGWALCMNAARDRDGMNRCQEAIQN